PEAMMSSLFCGVRYLSSTSRLPCAANAAVRTSIQNASGGSPAAKAVASFWWYSLKGNASRCTAMVGLAFAYSCSSASIAASRAGSADIQNRRVIFCCADAVWRARKKMSAASTPDGGRRVMGPPPRTSLSLFLAGGVKDSSHCVSSPCVRFWREESHEELHDEERHPRAADGRAGLEA